MAGLWLGLALLAGTAGCGSDSSATATFPRTATPVAQIQVVTPRPTATLPPDA
jgi:hypothetical protein